MQTLIDQMHLSQPAVFPIDSLTDALLNTQYGHYIERVSGDFEIIELFAEPSIIIDYIDGIRANIILQFTSAPGGGLMSYSLNISAAAELPRLALT